MAEDAVVIGARLDGSKIAEDAQRVAGQLDAAGKRMADNFLAPFKGIFATLIGAMGVASAVNQYNAEADAIGKLADSLDVAIEDLGAWSEAAARAGGSAQAFQGTLSTLNRQIQMAAAMGKGPGAMMLDELGIAYKDTSGKARDALEVMRDLAGKAENMSKQEFAGLAQKLGIDRGTIMLLQSGRASLDELIARQKSLGVYTKEDAEIAAKANDAMADFQQVLKAFAAGLLRVVVPALTFVTDKLTNVINFLRQHRPFVLAIIGMVSAALLAKMVPALEAVGKSAIKAMRPFLPWMIVLGTAALLIDDFYAYLQGGKSLFADFWSSFGTGEEITKNLTAVWEGFKSTVRTVLDALKPYFPTLAKIALGAGIAFSAFKIFSTVLSFLSPVKIIILAIAAAATLIYENWEPISKWFKEKWEQVRTHFQNFKNWLSGIWNKSIDAVVNFFKGSWDGLISWASATWELIKAPFVTTYNFLKTLFSNDDTGDKWSRTWDALVAVFTSIWNLIKAPFVSTYNFIKNLFGGDDTASKWANAWEFLGGSLSAAWELIKAPFKTAYDFIAGLFGDDTTAHDWSASWEGVTKFFSNLWNGITKIFDNGLKAITKVWNAVMGIFKSATETAKEVGKQAQEAGKFLEQNQNVDWDDVAERAANGEDVSSYYQKARPADGVKASSMEAGKNRMIEQTNNSTVNVGKVEIVTPATDANGLADSMGGALRAKGSSMDIVYSAQTGTVQKGGL